jgi:nitrous oxide reductase accessory protein NosL
MKITSGSRVCGILLCLVLFVTGLAFGAPVEKIDPKERCSICGMFVAKYDDWVVQLRFADNSVEFFDGVKDMMVFYHNPGKYSLMEQKDIREVWVKDYYTLKWLDGLIAYYVVGSDVYGPMGKEFIPFSTKAAAENFFKDHKGTKVLRFNEITDDFVQSMRTKSKMIHKSK